MISTESRSGSTTSSTPMGVCGFSDTPARLPSALICWRCGAGARRPRRAPTRWRRRPWRSPPGSARARRSSGARPGACAAVRAIAFTTTGPRVMLGTKRPSITSTWMRSPPAASAAWTSSASRPKSADSRLGAIRMLTAELYRGANPFPAGECPGRWGGRPARRRRAGACARAAATRRRPRRPPRRRCPGRAGASPRTLAAVRPDPATTVGPNSFIGSSSSQAKAPGQGSTPRACADTSGAGCWKSSRPSSLVSIGASVARAWSCTCSDTCPAAMTGKVSSSNSAPIRDRRAASVPAVS